MQLLSDEIKIMLQGFQSEWKIFLLAIFKQISISKILIIIISSFNQFLLFFFIYSINSCNVQRPNSYLNVLLLSSLSINLA